MDDWTNRRPQIKGSMEYQRWMIQKTHTNYREIWDIQDKEKILKAYIQYEKHE